MKESRYIINMQLPSNFKKDPTIHVHFNRQSVHAICSFSDPELSGVVMATIVTM